MNYGEKDKKNAGGSRAPAFDRYNLPTADFQILILCDRNLLLCIHDTRIF